VLLVAGAATLFILVAVVPAFADLFREFGQELPGPTRVLLAISGGITAYWWLVLLGAASAALGLRALFARPRVRAALERLALRVPVLGAVFEITLAARLCQTLGTLLQNGVRLREALPLAARTLSFGTHRRAVRRLGRLVESGRGLGEAARRVPEIAPLVVQMIAVGEETARLDALLLETAAHYEAELESRLAVLLSLLEPLLIVLVGLVLGAILVALYLPMFDLMNVVG
jgi:type IV pilus assembly protein PilC